MNRYKVVSTEGPLVALGDDGVVMISTFKGEHVTVTLYEFTGAGWTSTVSEGDVNFEKETIS